MNKYQEALDGLRFTCDMFLFDPFNGKTLRPEDLNEEDRITYESNKFAYEYLDKYRWHDLRKDPNDLPKGRNWVLALFKETDTSFVLVPRVADYVGRPAGVTTKENWIILDSYDNDMSLGEYYKNLECIAWKYIEEFIDVQ